MTDLLLRDARLHDAGLRDRVRMDVRIRAGRVAEIGRRLARLAGEDELDCAGGALLPGLCDHHLHLHALAAWRGSVRCGPPEVTGRAGLTAVLRAAVPDALGWIRGTGYAETVAGDLDAAALDHIRAGSPVRVQHRSGALWVLNTAALNAIGLVGPSTAAPASADSADSAVPSGPARSGAGDAGDSRPSGGHPGIERDASGRPTGRLWRADDWLRTRLPLTALPGLAPVGALLAGYGVTAVTDATPDLSPVAVAAITDAMRTGALPQRVQLLGAPLDTEPPRSRMEDRGGSSRPVGTAGPVAGPYKIVLADSGLPGYADLVDRIRAARAAGRAVAVHCVTREALALLLAALDETGPMPGDRIEHAALVPPEVIPELARLGLRVVTQPGFLADRGDDFLRDVPPADRPDLYRCAGFIRAGVPLALSSDAPYGPLDPWQIIAAAADRRTRSGRVAGAGERLTHHRALEAYLTPPHDPGGPARYVRTGMVADLVVLRTPPGEAPAAHPDPVRTVLIGGRPVFESC